MVQCEEVEEECYGGVGYGEVEEEEGRKRSEGDKKEGRERTKRGGGKKQVCTGCVKEDRTDSPTFIVLAWVYFFVLCHTAPFRESKKAKGGSDEEETNREKTIT